MKWAPDAETAVQKVPFFVRNKVKKRVEAFVADKGLDQVTLADVQALKRQFLAKGGMAREIRGYDVSACFGSQGCPNSVISSKSLVRDIEALMQKADILSFLRAHVGEDLKFHHEFRVSVSDCPNACSRPQITDIGIIGASRPELTRAPCSLCGACDQACPDQAIHLDGQGREPAGPVIDDPACLYCGKCVAACPEGTLVSAQTGYRVLLGGRLGRHPRLGMPVPGILSHAQVLDLVRRCLAFYKQHSQKGSRFSHILDYPGQVV